MFLSLEDYMLPCVSKTFFGMDCLGCGMQRSLLLLLKGDFFAAFKMYPAIYTLIIFVVFILSNSIFSFKNATIIIRLLFIVNVILIVGNFILKIQ